MNKISIIGSGSWGCALAAYLANRGNEIKMWSFSEEEANLINSERKCEFLPKIKIPESVTVYTNFKDAIDGTDFILHATPSRVTRNVVNQYKEFVNVQTQSIIICSKGFEKGTLETLDEVIQDEVPGVKIGALSGPSHAEEVSIGIPTVLTLASKHDEILTEIRDIFMSEKVRIYTSRDIKGVELGGALKNIIAFCAGIAAGIGLGDNSFAALITRGLKEITKLGMELGGEKDTFYGLSGLGDLIVTCLSQHSRNRRAGILIGEGKTLEETKKEIGMTIESIDNIEIAHELARIHNIEMPIVECVYRVLYSGLDPKEAVRLLMTREKKEEN